MTPQAAYRYTHHQRHSREPAGPLSATPYSFSRQGIDLRALSAQRPPRRRGARRIARPRRWHQRCPRRWPSATANFHCSPPYVAARAPTSVCLVVMQARSPDTARLELLHARRLGACSTTFCQHYLGAHLPNCNINVFRRAVSTVWEILTLIKGRISESMRTCQNLYISSGAPLHTTSQACDTSFQGARGTLSLPLPLTLTAPHLLYIMPRSSGLSSLSLISSPSFPPRISVSPSDAAARVPPRLSLLRGYLPYLLHLRVQHGPSFQASPTKARVPADSRVRVTPNPQNTPQPAGRRPRRPHGGPAL